MMTSTEATLNLLQIYRNQSLEHTISVLFYFILYITVYQFQFATALSKFIVSPNFTINKME